MIIVLIFVTTFVNAQEIELPDNIKKALGEDPKISNKTENSNKSKSAKYSDALDNKIVEGNIWQLRIEYVLQYEDNGVTTSLAKDDNDYFGYSNSFGIAGDDLIWFNKEQLKPWEIDQEYALYRTDTLKPVLSKVLAKKIGESDYVAILEVTEGITILNGNLVAYGLPSKSSSFKVKNNTSSNRPWLLLMGENESLEIGKPNLTLVSIDNIDEGTIDKRLTAKGFSEFTFTQGAILYSTHDSQNFYVSDFVYISNDKSKIIKMQYKKALKVVKTEGSFEDCCCEDIEKAGSKSERKAIIKKWKSLLKKTNKDIEKEEDANKRKALIKVKNQCQDKLDKI